MLLYNKALDPYHTYLRIITILSSLDKESFEEEEIFILDFILANPSHISKMLLGQALLREKNKFRRYDNVYNRFDYRSLFKSMTPIQKAIVANLLETHVLQREHQSHLLKLNRNNIPKKVLTIAFSRESSIYKDALEFISVNLGKLELHGKQGLKAASKLMEYRYDVV